MACSEQSSDLLILNSFLLPYTGEIPGLDPKKVLDIIMTTLHAKVNRRPCDIKEFRKAVEVHRQRAFESCCEKPQAFSWWVWQVLTSRSWFDMILHDLFRCSRGSNRPCDEVPCWFGAFDSNIWPIIYILLLRRETHHTCRFMYADIPLFCWHYWLSWLQIDLTSVTCMHGQEFGLGHWSHCRQDCITLI